MYRTHSESNFLLFEIYTHTQKKEIDYMEKYFH